MLSSLIERVGSSKDCSSTGIWKSSLQFLTYPGDLLGPVGLIQIVLVRNKYTRSQFNKFKLPVGKFKLPDLVGKSEV